MKGTRPGILGVVARTDITLALKFRTFLDVNIAFFGSEIDNMAVLEVQGGVAALDTDNEARCTIAVVVVLQLMKIVVSRQRGVRRDDNYGRVELVGHIVGHRGE